MPVWWRTRIEDWTPPVRFSDVQLRGPFRYWHHLHEFQLDGAGTLLKDTVSFDLYCRKLYQTPVLSWIDQDLRRIFLHRQKQIAAVFGEKSRR